MVKDGPLSKKNINFTHELGSSIQNTSFFSSGGVALLGRNPEILGQFEGGLTTGNLSTVYDSSVGLVYVCQKEKKSADGNTLKIGHESSKNHIFVNCVQTVRIQLSRSIEKMSGAKFWIRNALTGFL